LYSEELITLCLSTIKNVLTRIIYPFVEDNGATAHNDVQKRLIGEIFQSISSVLPKINTLVNAESVSMSDSIIIQAVYISIGPFFVVDGTDVDGSAKGKKEKDTAVSSVLGRSAMKGLRLDALSLIRSVSFDCAKTICFTDTFFKDLCKSRGSTFLGY
jgi:cohesin loading factor subunit SCC2